MARMYIEYDAARFTRKDITMVDMELYDGRKYENLQPRRLFPFSGLEKYITLLDEEGLEVAIIRDLRTLPGPDRKIIEDCLAQYYMIPKVTRILDIREKFGVITFDVETDHGRASIEIRNLIHGLKLVYGRRVLLRDSSDNRYEIPDLHALDKQSRQKIDNYL